MVTDRDTRAVPFDRLHRYEQDPWRFATSNYERKKRIATVAALDDQRFSCTLEIGCSTGHLSQTLARISDHVLALDISAEAIAVAEQRVAASPTITFQQAFIPSEWPQGKFDLIVFSEVLYFLTHEEIEQSAQLAYGSLAVGGRCLLVNWTGASDLPVSGEDAAAGFIDGAAWKSAFHQKRPNYQLDLLKL